MAKKIRIKEFVEDMRSDVTEKHMEVYETAGSGGAQAPVGAYVMADGSLVMLLDGRKLMTQ